MKLREIWDDDSYRTEGHIKARSIVFDLGANVGQFSHYCLGRGATVIAVEPFPDNIKELKKINSPYFTLIEGGIGPSDGWCTVEFHPSGNPSLGAYTKPGKGNTKMYCLKTLLKDFPVVDFMKCDTEGAEYGFFNDIVELRKIKRLSLEYHAWQEPTGTNPGVGLRNMPMPHDALKELTQQLEKVFTVEQVGDSTGGYLLCHSG